MKKIALAFYGLLRDMDRAYPYWKTNVIDPLNIKDIYVHTYRDEDEVICSNNTGQYTFKLGPSVLTEFYKLYKPTVVMHSDREDVKKTPYWLEPPIERVRACVTQTFSHQAIYFSMYNVINLIPEGKYDYVILSKVDQVFLRPLQPDEINAKENELLLSNFMWSKNFDNIYWSVSDFFAIGNLESIKKYASVGINYKDLYDSGIVFHAEITLGENLRKLGVKSIPYFKYPFDHHYIRNHEEILEVIRTDGLDTWSPLTLCYKE